MGITKVAKTAYLEVISGFNFNTVNQKNLPGKLPSDILKKDSPKAYWEYNQVVSISYHGEKTPGDIGAVKRYVPDYFRLRNRAYQSYLESEITKTMVDKYTSWIIGTGLKLNSEPVMSVIQASGLPGAKPDDSFMQLVEDRWKLYVKSKLADNAGVKTFNQLEAIAYKNCLLGGDILVILRTSGTNVTVQLIDPDHVKTPPVNDQNGKLDTNTIRNGIELSPEGKHIAYWVRTKSGFKRVLARGEKTGRLQAFMVYGNMFRIDNVRGIPIIASVLETLKKLERYKEAAVGAAEERAKIPYFITHDQHSTGANPLTERMAQQLKTTDSGNTTLAVSPGLRDQIAQTTGKMVFNLERGSKLNALNTDVEMKFKEFYDPMVSSIASSILMPPEVALSKYDSNFSSSRAALKDWEHMLVVGRDHFSCQFHQPIYELWLELQIGSRMISSDLFLLSRRTQDPLFKLAFLNARWIGANVPHIDPLKEVKAARAKIGPLAKNAPLSTISKETEGLNSGDYQFNVDRFTEEISKIPMPEESKDDDSENETSDE